MEFSNSGDGVSPDGDFYSSNFVAYTPELKSERCDACKIIARRFDSAFGVADAAIQDPDELSEPKELDANEVSDVVEKVCSKTTFADVTSVFDDTEVDAPGGVGEGRNRLAADGSDLWGSYQERKVKARNTYVGH